MSKEEKTSHEEIGEPEAPLQKQKDIKSLISVIPPASALKGTGKRITEKRIRVRYGSIKENKVKINDSLSKELGIIDKAYVVVAGRKRFVFTVIIDGTVPENIVIVNPDLMREHGIADNSIATIRRV